MRSPPKYASPAEVPIHMKPAESSKRQFTSSDGSPSWSKWTLHFPFDSALRPFGVPNHIVPSWPSRIDETVFETSPFAVVYEVNRPSFSLLMPRLRIPAQTDPSRLW